MFYKLMSEMICSYIFTTVLFTTGISLVNNLKDESWSDESKL